MIAAIGDPYRAQFSILRSRPPPRYCQKHKVHRSHSTTIFLVFMGFPFPIRFYA